MLKTIASTTVALVGIAAALLAPAASASPVLTEGVNTLAAGSSIKATNTLPTFFEVLEVECSHTQLNGTITSNTGTTVKGEIPIGSAALTGTGTGSDCTSPFGNVGVTVNSKLCFETSSADFVIFTGCGANVTYTLNVTGSAVCKYSVPKVPYTFKTAADAEFSTANALLVEEQPGNFFCPNEVGLFMTVDVLTTGGTTLLIS